jgi:Na+/H+-translocating membrane pyrophosphatase
LDLGRFFSFLILYTFGARRKETTGKTKMYMVDNIRMDLREIGWDGVDWIDRAQDVDQWRALVNTALNLRVP